MDLAHRNQLGWFHKPQAAPPSSVFLLYLCLYQRACREVVFLRETGLHQIKASRVAFSSTCFICRHGLCSLSGERDVLSCFFWYFPESSFHIHVTKNFPPNFFSPRPVFKTLLLWAVLSEKPQLAMRQTQAAEVGPKLMAAVRGRAGQKGWGKATGWHKRQNKGYPCPKSNEASELRLLYFLTQLCELDVFLRL